MQRRAFIEGIAALGVAWPLAARAQQLEHMRRIGVLMSAAVETDQQASLGVFKENLHQLGLIDGRNVRVEVRWAGGDPVEARKDAEELVALPADVIMVNGQLALQALLRATRSVPIVFIGVVDPVGSDYIDSLARPGGNATGFVLFEYALAGKWVELLKQIAPTVTRVAVLRDAAIPAGIGQFAVIQSEAPSIGVDVSAIKLRDAAQIEQDVTRFANSPNGGLIWTASALSVVHQKLIVALAAQHKLPAVYYRRYFVTSGGLVSYGPDIDEQYRGAASYVNRVDGLILPDEPHGRGKWRDYASLSGKRVIVIQTKTGRMGMYLMGQALFSARLVLASGAKSVRSILLCHKGDGALLPLLKPFPEVEVWLFRSDECAPVQTD